MSHARFCFSAILILLLALGFGCVNLTYDAKQGFLSDGTSTISITQKTGIDPSALATIASAGGSGSLDASKIASLAMAEYINSTRYEEDICKAFLPEYRCRSGAAGNEIAAKLSPGEHYAYESSVDWISLKEIRKYTIKKLPSISEFAKNKDMNAHMMASLEEYTKERAIKILDEKLSPLNCQGNLPFACEVSKNGQQAMFKLSDPDGGIAGSPYEYRVRWVVCSANDWQSFAFKDEERVKGEEGKLYYIDRVPGKEGIIMPIACPDGAKSLVVAYDKKPSSQGSRAEHALGAYEIASAEDMKAKILSDLEKSSGTSSTSPAIASIQGADASGGIDFVSGRIFGKTYDEIAKLKESGALLSAKIDINYEATFDGKVASIATSGGERLEANGNKLTMKTADFQKLPPGAIVVIVSKEMSPLGIYTWAIIGLAAIVAIAMAIVLVGRMRQPEHASGGQNPEAQPPMPPEAGMQGAQGGAQYPYGQQAYPPQSQEGGQYQEGQYQQEQYSQDEARQYGQQEGQAGAQEGQDAQEQPANPQAANEYPRYGQETEEEVRRLTRMPSPGFRQRYQSQEERRGPAPRKPSAPPDGQYEYFQQDSEQPAHDNAEQGGQAQDQGFRMPPRYRKPDQGQEGV